MIDREQIDNWENVPAREAAARAMCKSYFPKTHEVKWRHDAETRRRFRKMADLAFAEFEKGADA